MTTPPESIPDNLQNSDAPTTPAKAAVPRKRRGRIVGIVFLFVFLFCCYIGVFGGNVRVVEPGKLYRSCQLTGSGYDAVSARAVGHGLESVLSANGIKTVLNLRAGSMKDKRYREEIEICQKLGVEHIDDTFSARSLPPPDVAAKLLDIFDHAKYPILVHCQAGSDRTGLASALYAHVYMKQPLDEATGSQLTWRYGHFRFSNTKPMDIFFDLYRETGQGMTLREWIKKKYPQVYETHQAQK